MHITLWDKIVLGDSGVLLSFGIKSIIICAAAGVAHFALRNRSASLCHSIWAVCMVSLLALPILARLMPHWALFKPGAPPVALVQSVFPLQAVLSKPAQVVSAGLNPFPGKRALSAESDGQANGLEWLRLQWLAILWLAGCALLLGNVLAAYSVAYLMVRLGRPVDAPFSATDNNDRHPAVRFIRTRHVRVPMLFGVFRPVVLLPLDFDAWPEDRQRAACRHELAHLKRQDCLTHLAARVACAFFWPNPLVWVGARFMALLRERACDELVVKTGINRADYAARLLEVARLFKAGPAIALGVVSSDRVSTLEKRIRYLLQESPPNDASWICKGIGLSGALLLLATVASAQTQGQAPRPSAATNASTPVELLVIKGKWADALQCSVWTIANVGKTNQAMAKLMPDAPIRGEGAPTFSPDGKQMAFAIWDNGHSSLVAREIQTGVERPINTVNTGPMDCDSPSWSPDGKRIAFVGWVDGRTNCQIYTMNLDGTDRHQLTRGDTQFNWSPSYSPDGKKILWEHEEGESNDGREIYVMNVDGSDQTNLTRHFGVDHHPAWSPEGSKIAFMSRRETGNAEIYVMNADGSNPLNLTQNSARDSEPAWSADGQWIAFTRSEDASFGEFSSMDVYVMRADGTGQTNITKNESGISCWNPVWK